MNKLIVRLVAFWGLLCWSQNAFVVAKKKKRTRAGQDQQEGRKSDVVNLGRRRGLVNELDFQQEDGHIHIKAFADDTKAYDCFLHSSNENDDDRRLNKGGGGRSKKTAGNPMSCEMGKVTIFSVEEEAADKNGFNDRALKPRSDQRRRAYVVYDGESGMTYEILLNKTIIERYISDFPEEEEEPLDDDSALESKIISEGDMKADMVAEMEIRKRRLSQSSLANNLRIGDMRIDFIEEEEKNHHHRQLEVGTIVQVDVMVIWTQDAENSAGGQSQIRATINMAVLMFNQAAQNSGVYVRIRLVHAVKDSSGYSEVSRSMSDHLNAIRNTNDGLMDQVHDLRDEYGADLVALITQDTCGIASIRHDLSSQMFSATGLACISQFTFVHELGHNFGALHDRATEDACGDSGYQYGYRDPEADFRTVLSYNCAANQCDNNQGGGCIRQPYFSNPDPMYTFNGQPIGSPAGSDLGETNNAKRLNENRFIMAAHRPTVICDTDEDCDDNNFCTEDTCVNGSCVYTTRDDCLFLETTLEGGNGANGNMFDIVANNDVTVSGFDIHCGEGGGIAHVYTKSGSHVNFENNPSAWTRVSPVHGFGVSCIGPEAKTSLPSLTNSVPINAGETQSFYIYLEDHALAYTNGDNVGNVFASDENIDFLEGVGKGSVFGSTFSPRIFNGVIRYQLGSSLALTIMPSQLPTISPTTSLVPSESPIISPTRVPSGIPSLAPTPDCTRPDDDEWFIITSDGCNDRRSFGTNEEITMIYYNDNFDHNSVEKIEVEFKVRGDKDRKTKFKLDSAADLSRKDSFLPKAFSDGTIRITILMEDIGKIGGWDGGVTSPPNDPVVPGDWVQYKLKVDDGDRYEIQGTDLIATQPITAAPTSGTLDPTGSPSSSPTDLPSTTPTTLSPTLSMSPSLEPSTWPSKSISPSRNPTASPSESMSPSLQPSASPSLSVAPSRGPSSSPSTSISPTAEGTDAPSRSMEPNTNPSPAPSKNPSESPTQSPSSEPSDMPSAAPQHPSAVPSSTPSSTPSSMPSPNPSGTPSLRPSSPPSTSVDPSSTPTQEPSYFPTDMPSSPPSHSPTRKPTPSPTSSCQLPDTSTWLVIGTNGESPCNESLIVDLNDEVTFVFYDEDINPNQISKIEVEFKVLGDKDRKTKWKIESNFFQTSNPASPHAFVDVDGVVRFRLTVPVNVIGAIGGTENPDNDPVKRGEWIAWKWKVTAGDKTELKGTGTSSGIRVV